MAPDDEDSLFRKVRAQHRSVSFVTGSELVNIDLGDESSRRDEDSELNETVCMRTRSYQTLHFDMSSYESSFDKPLSFPGITTCWNIGQ